MIEVNCYLNLTDISDMIERHDGNCGTCKWYMQIGYNDLFARVEMDCKYEYRRPVESDTVACEWYKPNKRTSGDRALIRDQEKEMKRYMKMPLEEKLAWLRKHLHLD
jgi:hypothetical protein